MIKLYWCKGGLLYLNGTVVGVGIADTIAQANGYSCAELFTKALDGLHFYLSPECIVEMVIVDAVPKREVRLAELIEFVNMVYQHAMTLPPGERNALRDRVVPFMQRLRIINHG